MMTLIIRTNGIGSAHLPWRPMGGLTRFGTTLATTPAICFRSYFILTAQMQVLLGLLMSQ
jgi:hypothetical protein